MGRTANHSGCVVPEYARTTDGDVYSFGVMLLELVTRVKPTIEVDLVEWISQLSSTSDLGEAVDGFLVEKGFNSEISRVLEVACDCVLSGRRERPTMLEVHKLLRGISIKSAKCVKLSMFEKSISKLSLYDLMKATNNFSNGNITRTGGTWTTYKAVLQNGTSLVVKWSQNHTQHSEKEFVSEMTALGNCKHRNLVPLIGFCLTKKERFLVYKHMPNGTLHDKLHVINEGDGIMDWPVRLKIATGAAKGLAWLHRMSLVHWNITSKFVLLDADYEPKICVPAGLFSIANNSGSVGPVFARTTDGDVYSFGVMLLELVTRVKPIIEVDLVEWISRLSSTFDLGEAVDGFLVGKSFYSEISRVLEVTCSYVLPGRRERPMMFEVHELLRGIARHYDFAMEDEISVDVV